MSNYTADQARRFLQLGLNVHAIRLDGSKAPIGKWTHLQDRLATEEEISQWFDRDNPWGIGVIIGRVSGNLHVLDFDNVPAFERFWTEAAGLVEQTVVIATPRPGRQVWFRQASAPPGSQDLAYNQAGEKTIETRGTGAYVATVGSPVTVHPNGTPYQLIHGDFAKIPIFSDRQARWLINLCRSYDCRPPESDDQFTPGEQYNGEPRPGDVFDKHYDPRPLLQQHGWSFCRRDSDGVDIGVVPEKTLLKATLPRTAMWRKGETRSKNFASSARLPKLHR